MGGLLVQFLGLVALLGLVAWGYRHWIRPRRVGIHGKGMLLLSVLTLVGGLLGSTGWWIDDPRSFSWDSTASTLLHLSRTYSSRLFLP